MKRKLKKLRETGHPRSWRRRRLQRALDKAGTVEARVKALCDLVFAMANGSI